MIISCDMMNFGNVSWESDYIILMKDKRGNIYKRIDGNNFLSVLKFKNFKMIYKRKYYLIIAKLLMNLHFYLNNCRK